MDEVIKLRLIPYNYRLLSTRKAKELTQAEVALLVGISTTKYQFIENLRTVPKNDDMNDIASALQADRDYLFPEELLEAVREGMFKDRVKILDTDTIRQLHASNTIKYLPTMPIENLEFDIDLKREIDKGLDKLKLNERTVLKERYGLEEGCSSKSLREVGKIINTTPERVRQIEASALRRLRHPSRLRKLREYLE